MKTATRKTNPILVAQMTAFYGSIEAARMAYREAKGKCRETRGEVLWVTPSGRIGITCAGDVQYVGSADAHRVLS